METFLLRVMAIIGAACVAAARCGGVAAEREPRRSIVTVRAKRIGASRAVCAGQETHTTAGGTPALHLLRRIRRVRAGTPAL